MGGKRSISPPPNRQLWEWEGKESLAARLPPARTFAFDLRPERVKFSALVYVWFHTIHALLV